MKTKHWILLLSLLLLLSLGGSLFVLYPQEASAFAEITSSGQVIRTVDLRIDQSFTVTTASGGHNVVTVQDGKIAVTEASCPDHYCMERGYRNSGTAIVCLPNKLVISFLNNGDIDISVG